MENWERETGEEWTGAEHSGATGVQSKSGAQPKAIHCEQPRSKPEASPGATANSSGSRNPQMEEPELYHWHWQESCSAEIGGKGLLSKTMEQRVEHGIVRYTPCSETGDG